MSNITVSTLDHQLDRLPDDVVFCRRCAISNQRPRIHFEDGICGACRFANHKATAIDWVSRQEELRDLCDQYRREDGRFDVVIPASGGKDSARVAYELKNNYGMHPLTVTWAPFEYTDIGLQNFRNFVKLGGFTNLMAWPNGNLHRKLARVAFDALGDAWQPFTYGQVCYAFHMAKLFDIRLVFFGENGEAEYSGDPSVFDLSGMPVGDWTQQYFKGVTIDDLLEYALSETSYLHESDFTQADLTFYRPPEGALEEIGNSIQFKWFSYYKKWIPQENYYLASEHAGFEANPVGRSEGTYSKYASLDDRMDGFHYYLAFIKFGIGRATSDAAHEVRDGHITREEAAALVHRYDGEFPARYFYDFLDYLQITQDEFWAVVDKYRRNAIWRHTHNGWRLHAALHDEYENPHIPGYITSLPESLSRSETIVSLSSADPSPFLVESRPQNK